MEEREDRGIGQKRKLRGGKGSTGGPPFTNPIVPVRHYKYTDCTVFNGPQMQHGLRVLSNAPTAACPINAQTINICERNGVCCTL
jgi:hypothetical protein